MALHPNSIIGRTFDWPTTLNARGTSEFFFLFLFVLPQHVKANRCQLLIYHSWNTKLFWEFHNISQLNKFQLYHLLRSYIKFSQLFTWFGVFWSYKFNQKFRSYYIPVFSSRSETKFASFFLFVFVLSKVQSKKKKNEEKYYLGTHFNSFTNQLRQPWIFTINTLICNQS